jgi:hypothetical protein
MRIILTRVIDFLPLLIADIRIEFAGLRRLTEQQL